MFENNNIVCLHIFIFKDLIKVWNVLYIGMELIISLIYDLSTLFYVLSMVFKIFISYK